MSGQKKVTWLCATLLTLALFTGCGSDEEISNSGRVTISSIFNYSSNAVEGYNFATGNFASFPASSGTLPDIIVENFRVVDGPPKAGFNSPNNAAGFALVEEFENLTASTSFYQGLAEFDTTPGLSASSDTVKRYQVWELQTASDIYVKLHIIDIQDFTNDAGDYTEVTFDFLFQDNGSTRFPE